MLSRPRLAEQDPPGKEVVKSVPCRIRGKNAAKNDHVVTLNCGHVFCRRCFLDYLRFNDSCIVSRRKLGFPIFTRSVIRQFHYANFSERRNFDNGQLKAANTKAISTSVSWPLAMPAVRISGSCGAVKRVTMTSAAR